MSDKSTGAAFDNLLDLVTGCFTPEVARGIASLRASPEVQARLDELADRCSDGTITVEERGVYEAAVRTVNFIGVLQAKAQAMLANKPSGD